MAIIKSDSTDLTINADGASSSLKLQINGVEKASISSAGFLTSTTIDATKLTGTIPSASYTDTDTVYTHPTTAGDKHIPTGGAADQVLTYDSSGTAVWADAGGGGKVLQVLSDIYTDSYYNSSIGSSIVIISGLSVTITPASTSSRFIIQWCVPNLSTAAYNYEYIMLLRGSSTIIGHKNPVFSGSDHTYPFPNLVVDSPSTTSPVTYQLGAQDTASNSNLYINMGTQMVASGSTLIVWELDS